MKKSNASRAGAEVERTEPSAEARIAGLLRDRAAKLGPGARMPSVRELCASLGASPVTVNRAFSALAREGLLEPRPGVGTFVALSDASHRGAPRDDAWQLGVLGAFTDSAESRALDGASPGQIELGSGYLDATLQPVGLVARAARRVAGNARLWGRLPVEGLPDLRAWFARDVAGEATERDVLVVPGGQAALATTLRALSPFGGAVLTESPTYFGALAVVRTLGLRAVPIPVDDEGIVTEGLEAAFRASGARVLYLQPTYSNPSGTRLSHARRREVLEIAARVSAFVVEDDYARDLGYGKDSPPPLFRDPLAAGRVVYLRSLTKTTVPGLRVAAIVAQGPVFGRLRAMRAAEDMFLSGFLQGLALEIVTAPAWEAHKRALRHTLRARRDIALTALSEHFPSAKVVRVPEGGFALWVALPRGLEDHDFTRKAAEKGVHVNEGAAWFPSAKSGELFRIAVAGAHADDIERGVRVLGKIGERAYKRA